MNAYFRNIIPFSAVDGPGNRTVVFLQGCNMNCMYCHNPETIPAGEQDDVEMVSPEALLERIKPYLPFVSGVSISGGECTYQGDFLIEFCTLLKANDVHVLLDSNGLISEARFEALLSVCDGFMFDVKMVSAANHKQLTGVENDVVLTRVARALALNKVFEIRTVLYENSPEMEETVKWVSKAIVESGNKARYKLIRYRDHGVREAFRPMLKGISNAESAQYFKVAKDMGVLNAVLV